MKHLKLYDGVFNDLPEHEYKFVLDDYIYDYCQEVAFIIGPKRNLEKALGEPRVEHPRGYSSPITYWSIDFDDGLAVDIHAYNNSMQSPDTPYDLNDFKTRWYCSFNEYDWTWSDKIYTGRSEKEVLNRMSMILHDCEVVPEQEYKDRQRQKLADYIQAKQAEDRKTNEGVVELYDLNVSNKIITELNNMCEIGQRGIEHYITKALDNPKFDPTIENNRILSICIYSDSWESIERLSEEGVVDLSANDNAALKLANSIFKLGSIKRLIRDDNVMRTIGNIPFHDMIDSFKELLMQKFELYDKDELKNVLGMMR